MKKQGTGSSGPAWDRPELSRALLGAEVDGTTWQVVGQLRRKRTRALDEPSCPWERTTLMWSDDRLTVRVDRLCPDTVAGWTARWASVTVPVLWQDGGRFVLPADAGAVARLSALHEVEVGGVRARGSRTWTVSVESLRDGGLLEHDGDRLLLRTEGRRGLALVRTAAEPDWDALAESL